MRISGCRLSSRSGTGHDRAGRPADQVDDYRVRGRARTDRWDRVLAAHARASSDAWPAWVGSRADPAVSGRDVAASTTLLAESWAGSRGGLLSWSLLAVGSVASLAATSRSHSPRSPGG